MAEPERSSTPVQSAEDEIRALYHAMIDGWNRKSAEGFAAPFAEDGESIGFDGSQTVGQANIVSDLQRIFADHPTGTYVGKVKGVRPVAPHTAVLRAVAGVVPAGQSDLRPELNSIQTVVFAERDGQWRIVLLQNTPAQFHGRPELVDALTEELREVRQAEPL